ATALHMRCSAGTSKTFAPRGPGWYSRAAKVERNPATIYDCGVTTNAQKLFEQALSLVASDRAELAAQLLASLDHAEADVESAWAREFERRAAEARQNPDDDE